MLIEFSVENHRAFREKQVFSMVASSSTERAGHGHVLETGMSTVPKVLSAACIFGANGAGKSSLLDAMQFMRGLVMHSFHDTRTQGLRTAPFRFHSEWRGRPSEFEVVFLHEGQIFQYGFAVDNEKVLEEWLFARPRETQRERQIFTRTFDVKSGEYIWEMSAEHLKGKKESWKLATREDALFLTTAVFMNAKGLQAPFKWFQQIWRLFDSEDIQTLSLSDKRLMEADGNQLIRKFMKDADIPLDGLRAEERELSPKMKAMMESLLEAIDVDSGVKSEFLKEDDRKTIDVVTVRKDETNADIELPLEEESSGTRMLFKLAAPILDVLANGYVLFVDELNTNLHPLAFQHIVSLFADSKSNPNGAQLVFTTHDTSVADQECMGRDQIWLVDKGNNLAAELIPLSDFKERDAKGFQKKYLDGRFGGIPRVAI
jgi:uncharacterized protein